jgi:glutathionylspermidine synthase
MGLWMVGDESVALGIREDRGRVTRNLSRYVPHVILD